MLLSDEEAPHSLTAFMPYSHHSHSGQFCKHASGTLEEVVLEAVQKGFEVYGLTEHIPRYRTVDLYPEEVLPNYHCPLPEWPCSDRVWQGRGRP